MLGPFYIVVAGASSDFRTSGPGVVVQAVNSGALSLITSPSVDNLFGWDNTDGAYHNITIGTNLNYDHATHTLNASTGGMTIGAAVSGSTNYDILSIDGSGNLSQISPATAGYVLTSNGVSASATFQAPFVGGSDTQVLYNDSGVETGNANLTWNYTAKILTATTTAGNTAIIGNAASSGPVGGLGSDTYGVIGSCTVTAVTYQGILGSNPGPLDTPAAGHFQDGTNTVRICDGTYALWIATAAISINGVAYSWPGTGAAGYLKNDGSGNLTWSSVTTTISIGDAVGLSTNYDILSIDGSGNLSQIDPSTAGFVLTSNGTGAPASFQTIPSIRLTTPDAHIETAPFVIATPNSVAVTGDSSHTITIQLVNDGTPTASQYYGTDSGSTLGYHNLPSAPTGANPTAMAAGNAVNGSAATFMRSDAAPAMNPWGQILYAKLGLGF